jgi:hypothetical protein
MLTVMVLVLLASLLSGTTLTLSAVAFIVCRPFFALAVSQFTVTGAEDTLNLPRTDFPMKTNPSLTNNPLN